MDAYNYYCNKEDEKQERLSKSYDRFVESIQEELNQIEDLIKDIKRTALNFDGYDFSEDAEDLIKEII